MKKQIAASLESAFSELGFAEPSVAQLKSACDVSLRTLYKHYPSKEEMIVAALEHRHQRYLNFLLEGAPNSGLSGLLHTIDRLGLWMEQFAPNGCLSLHALAAFPDNALIKSTVNSHKEDVKRFLGTYAQDEKHSTQLFLIHEGVSSAWPIIGVEALLCAKTLVTNTLSKEPQ